MKIEIHNTASPFHKYSISMLFILPKYNTFNPINKLIIFKT